jgi:hypothetical protein
MRHEGTMILKIYKKCVKMLVFLRYIKKTAHKMGYFSINDFVKFF